VEPKTIHEGFLAAGGICKDLEDFVEVFAMLALTASGFYRLVRSDWLAGKRKREDQ
jgi:hypothetical protein